MARNSFLRWAGSKQKLIPQLKLFWGEGHNRYIEPFMGSAQLFFHLNPKKAIISDINKDLVETFTQIKKNPYPIHRYIQTWGTSEKDYYHIRSLDPSELGVNQRAARFIYLNKFCFNGLYRTNSSGQFNVPYGGINNLDSFKFLKGISEKLSKAKIVCNDFAVTISKEVKCNDFVYLDPPYAVGNKKIFNQYGGHTFGLNDLDKLKFTIQKIDNRGAYFLLSYASCTEIINLFQNWNIYSTFTQRNIAGFAKYRRKEEEVFITNIQLNE